MITEAIIHVLTAVVNFALGLMPDVTIPDWVSSITDTINSGVAPMEQLDHWLPIGPIGVVLAFVLLIWGVALALRIARIAAGYFTGGGGG